MDKKILHYMQYLMTKEGKNTFTSNSLSPLSHFQISCLKVKGKAIPATGCEGS
jgi:hypothetical protein